MEVHAMARNRALNDDFRRTFVGGRVMMTQGIDALPPEEKAVIIQCVRTYDAFSADNDPHGEHDFGSFDFRGERIFWKIDCYDADCVYGSEDPSDPDETIRVLTIMLATEY